MALIALVVVTLFSQGPLPNFSGTWNMVAARSGSPMQTPPVSTMTFAIQQQADQISIESTTGDAKSITTIYPIVPAPKPPADPLGAGLARAYWEGKRLVIERGGTISGQTVSARQALTLSADGSEMTVERLVIVQHGYTLKGAKNYASAKDVFARVQQ